MNRFFKHFVEILSGEVFESIGPPFEELLATILETFGDQRGKVKTGRSSRREPSREGQRESQNRTFLALELESHF